MIDEKNRGKSRGRSLIKILSLLGVYANSEKVLLAHAPSKKRSQREDVIAAIAAKDAAAAPAAVAPIRENVGPVAAQCSKKINPTANKRPQLREPVQPADGEKLTHFRCKGCDFTRLAPIFSQELGRPLPATTATRTKMMLQKIKTMAKLMTSTSPDTVLPG